MKINEFQNRAVASPVGEQVNEIIQGTVPPLAGTENYRRLINSIASDMIAAAVTAEKAGLTLQYICEVALESCTHIDTDEEKHYGN
jgi:hypothetical protein